MKWMGFNVFSSVLCLFFGFNVWASSYLLGESPSLSLRGDASLTVEAGSEYVDQGAIAMDAVEGDISSRILVQGHVNTSVLGQYVLTYHVSDVEEYEAKPITRIVSVVDTTPPEVIAPKAVTVLSKHDLPVHIYLGVGTALDLFPLTITNDAPDVYPVGNTLVTWHVVDENGNRKSVTQMVTVIAGESIAKNAR